MLQSTLNSAVLIRNARLYLKYLVKFAVSSIQYYGSCRPNLYIKCIPNLFQRGKRFLGHMLSKTIIDNNLREAIKKITLIAKLSLSWVGG